jgi:valyl-tRNA synthetase
MPFITEEIWSKLPNLSLGAMPSVAGAPVGMPGVRSMLVSASFPVANPALHDLSAESQIAIIQSLTSAIREIQNRYPAAKGKPVVLQPRDAAMQQVIEQSRLIIEPLAGITIADNSPSAKKPDNAATAVLADCQIFIGGVIDKSAESAKLTKRKAELEKFILGNRNKLANVAFVAKAPPNIIQGLRDQLAKQEEEAAAIDKNLQELGCN